MILRKHKYLLSLGVGFYPEREMLRLKTQAAKGWQFVEMNRWGLLVFKKASPCQNRFAVDFFDGEKSEISDYLSVYEASGWHFISQYRHRYFYFQASSEAVELFSDRESYQERIQRERVYLIKKSFWLTLIGALLLSLTFLGHYVWLIETPFLLHFGYCLGSLLFFYPALVAVTIFIYSLLYKNREAYFREPEKLACQQRVTRDTFVMMGVGGLIGGIIGLFFGAIL